ncbi:unnamed protein product [Gadus morhua 'NCC']
MFSRWKRKKCELSRVESCRAGTMQWKSGISISVLRVLDWMPGLSSWITSQNPITILI